MACITSLTFVVDIAMIWALPNENNPCLFIDACTKGSKNKLNQTKLGHKQINITSLTYTINFNVYFVPMVLK